MSLACGDHIAFYASKDLKTWRWLSNFGHTAGAHGGVWECPDLVALSLNGLERWVLWSASIQAVRKAALRRSILWVTLMA
jgi:sucrose-6-phosphate hydrolase SacC (GH32 family)